MEKQYLMLKVIMTYYAQMNDAMNRGVTLKQIQGLPFRTGIGRMKDIGNIDDLKKMIGEISTGLTALEVEK
jgi:vacuolar-type H+-ATPase catalytic subunit A/Vma1